MICSETHTHTTRILAQKHTIMHTHSHTHIHTWWCSKYLLIKWGRGGLVLGIFWPFLVFLSFWFFYIHLLLFLTWRWSNKSMWNKLAQHKTQIKGVCLRVIYIQSLLWLAVVIFWRISKHTNTHTTFSRVCILFQSSMFFILFILF